MVKTELPLFCLLYFSSRCLKSNIAKSATVFHHGFMNIVAIFNGVPIIKCTVKFLIRTSSLVQWLKIHAQL